jgi:prevent-host-death family protein
MESVNIYDAKTHLSSLVARVEAGEEITISRHGRAVARLVPMGGVRHDRIPGALAERLRVPSDLDRFDESDASDWYGG